MKNTGIILIGAGIAAYFLFLKSKSGEGGSGGSLSTPLDVLGAGAGNVTGTPSQESPFQPSQFLLDLMSKKGSIDSSTGSSSYLSGVPVSSATGAFQSSYPVVMYDSSKGGNQLAVQSAPQMQNFFAKMTGGLGTSSDLTLKKSSSSSSSSPSISYSGGNSAGSSSTLHSRMGVK